MGERYPCEVGDVVRLKSGGPEMVVVALNEGVASLAWFEPDRSDWSEMHRTVAPVGALERADG